jgi:hypothetical protein
LAIPFTENELFDAFRVFHSESQAREMARQTIEGDRANGEALLRSNDRSGVEVTIPLAGTTLSPDLLIILSLRNDAMSRRVTAYLGGAMDDARFRTLWNARRAELMADLRDTPLVDPDSV